MSIEDALNLNLSHNGLKIMGLSVSEFITLVEEISKKFNVEPNFTSDSLEEIMDCVDIEEKGE